MKRKLSFSRISEMERSKAIIKLSIDDKEEELDDEEIKNVDIIKQKPKELFEYYDDVGPSQENWKLGMVKWLDLGFGVLNHRRTVAVAIEKFWSVVLVKGLNH